MVSNRVFSWGIATWKNPWEDIDLSNKPAGYNPFGKLYKTPVTNHTKYTLTNQFFLEKNHHDPDSSSQGIRTHHTASFFCAQHWLRAHPDSKNYKGAEPSWVNARYEDSVHLDSLPHSPKLIQPLATQINGCGSFPVKVAA